MFDLVLKYALIFRRTHIFEELTSSNTNLLPACFIMKLKERLPICESLIEQMKEITDIEVNKVEGPFPILSLIKREIHKKFVECDEDSSIVVFNFLLSPFKNLFSYSLNHFEFL